MRKLMAAAAAVVALHAGPAAAAVITYEFTARFDGFSDIAGRTDFGGIDAGLLAATSTDLTVGALYSGSFSLQTIPTGSEDIGGGFATRFFFDVFSIELLLEAPLSVNTPRPATLTGSATDITGNIDTLSVRSINRVDPLPDGERSTFLATHVSLQGPDTLFTGDFPIDLTGLTSGTLSLNVAVDEGDILGGSIPVAFGRGLRASNFTIESVTAVPAPPSLALLGSALAALAFRRRRARD